MFKIFRVFVFVLIFSMCIHSVHAKSNYMAGYNPDDILIELNNNGLANYSAYIKMGLVRELLFKDGVVPSCGKDWAVSINLENLKSMENGLLKLKADKTLLSTQRAEINFYHGMSRLSSGSIDVKDFAKLLSDIKSYLPSELSTLAEDLHSAASSVVASQSSGSYSSSSSYNSSGSSSNYSSPSYNYNSTPSYNYNTGPSFDSRVNDAYNNFRNNNRNTY